MATLNLGRIKPVFKGAYSGGTAYVIDDIVTHGNESFICIQAHGAGTQATSVTAYWTKLAAKGTDGTDLTSTLTTQGDVLFRDGSGLQRLAKGTAGQVLKINSGATAPEWGTDTGGKVLKVSQLENNTRTTYSDSNNGTFLSLAFTKDNDASTSYIIAQAQLPIFADASDQIGEWSQMDTQADPGDNAAAHTGTNFIAAQGNHKGGVYVFKKFTGLTAASHTLYVGWNATSNSAQGPGVLNPNSSDEGRMQQSSSTCTFWEIAT